MGLFAGVEVVLETNLTEPIRIPLEGGDGQGEPSPVPMAIRPKLTIMRNGTALSSVAPWGAPSRLPLGWLFLAVCAGAFLLILVRAGK